MFYITVILIANLIIALSNCFVNEKSFLFYLGLSIAATAEVIAVDAVTAFAIRRFPEKYFDVSTTVHSPKWERCLYRRLSVKRWSSFVPELGVFTGFSKRKLESRDDKEYLARFILESNYGVYIHVANALFGGSILLLPAGNIYGIGIPVTAVNFLLSLMPAAILRNNLPMLQRLYNKKL
ncbi:MAG: hypothetical protein E7623_05880 [Ruminococcaceae bacterium]|nr:hypothetical protein [Oscillospiraceae bacterium]